MKLLSSNKNKLKEYQEYFPEVESAIGPDIREVLGTKEEVIIYKTLEQEDNVLVEDTILEILEDGEWREVVDIKFKMKSIQRNVKARWIVSIGVKKNDVLKLYEGSILGTLNQSFEKGFGFDPFFIPEGETLTLHQLNKKGEKRNHSARMKAIENIKNNKVYKELLIKDIPLWKGKYQNEE